MRDNLVRLGITKLSAGVTTSVGGHTKQDDSSQFTISDNRSVSENGCKCSKIMDTNLFIKIGRHYEEICVWLI